MMEKLRQAWKSDRLYTVTIVLWLLTVAAAFIGPYLLPVPVPGMGTLYAFRALLPVTAGLYLLWMILHRELPWTQATIIEKWCDVLGLILLLYGAASLFRAQDFLWTRDRLFNLVFDVTFFLLAIRMLRRPAVRDLTVKVCIVMLCLIVVLGLYEVFFGGLVNSCCDDLKQIQIFDGMFQSPVVFSGNPNDYAATVLLMAAAALLWYLRPDNRWSKWGAVGVAALAVCAYMVPVLCSGRLCVVASVILLAAIVLYFLCSKKRGRILVVAVILIGVLSVEFVNRYYYLMPQIKAYTEALITGQSLDGLEIQLQRPGGVSLEDQFFEIDKETGEVTLRGDASAGIRTKLLIHAGDCFLDSYGLGVGLGNSEMLARDLKVTGDTGIWNIHCFIARLLADYGIFVLIPLCTIAWLLLRRILHMLRIGVRGRRWEQAAYALLALGALGIYPIVSTAPADAQDLLVMWLYLALAAVLPRWLSDTCKQREIKA